jgi:hypothetical protein
MSDDSIELDLEIAAILREAAGLDLPDPTALPIADARAQLTAASSPGMSICRRCRWSGI